MGRGGQDVVHALSIDDEKNIYIAAGSFGESEVLAKYSSDGEKIWGYTESISHYFSVSIENGVNIYFGSGGQNDRVNKFNADGQKLWSSNDAGETEWSAKGIALDSYGNLYVCGGSNENHLIKIPASEMK